MHCSRSSSARHTCALLAALGFAVFSAPGPGARALAADVNHSPINASLEDYRKHLESLEALVDSCRKQRTREACDPARTGPDDRVQWTPGGAAGTREIRYNWLRDLLERAGNQEPPQKAAAAPVEVVKARPLTVDALLAQARQRLEQDWSQAGLPSQANQGHAAERASLTAILAGRQYQGVSATSARERFLEWLENRLVDLLARLMGFGSRSPWIGFTLLVLLLVSVCVGLVSVLLRIERRTRARLVPELQPAAGAPSTREWQAWLKDAHGMAAQGRWREAIHFLYWAAISRLEAKRLWPADRARTPREYLRLFPGADPRKTILTMLTRSFERTWYGGREARPSDFEAALKLASELGVE
ncbi:MAG: DUF4129 domain-containing protein [Terracidiphilus sp.]